MNNVQLRDHLDGYNFAAQLQEVNTFLDTAQTRITFWGGRVLESTENYSGSVYLDDIAKKTTQAAARRMEADNLTMQERQSGVEIVEKLRNFYEVSDTQVSDRNWFTRLLTWIREFHVFPYTTRFHIEDMGLTHGYFRLFSHDRYARDIGEKESGYFGYPLSSGSINGKPMIDTDELKHMATNS